MATMCTLTSRSDACLRHPRTVHLHYMHMPENSRTRGVLSSRESPVLRGREKISADRLTEQSLSSTIMHAEKRFERALASGDHGDLIFLLLRSKTLRHANFMVRANAMSTSKILILSLPEEPL